MGKLPPYADTAGRGRSLTEEEAKKLEEILGRPARKPTPRMRQAIENYRRLMAMECADCPDETKPS